MNDTLNRVTDDNHDFEEWWSNEGIFLDPDSSPGVHWFDKRKDLCAYAYYFGKKVGQHQALKAASRSEIWDTLCHDCGWKGKYEDVGDNCPKCNSTQLWERMESPKRESGYRCKVCGADDNDQQRCEALLKREIIDNSVEGDPMSSRRVPDDEAAARAQAAYGGVSPHLVKDVLRALRAAGLAVYEEAKQQAERGGEDG